MRELFMTSAFHSLFHRVFRKFPPPLLTYTPNGWDTVLEDDMGWNDPSAVAEEKRKWGEFMTLVPGSGPLGFSHEHSDLTISRNPLFHNVHITFGYVLGLAAHHKTSLSVLDYGGGLGHYYQIAKTLFPDLNLEYHCWEVQSMAEAGKNLNPDVMWHTNKKCLERSYDLVMISGSLQYVEHWQEFLLEISGVVPIGNYLYLTRVPIVENVDSYVAVQKVFKTRMLHWQFNKDTLLKGVEKAGFRIVREFVVGDTVLVINAPEQFKLCGWLFLRVATT
jgi:putative methyltransferase (TIGR04325 family)